MATTLSDMRGYVRNRLDDDTFEDLFLDRAINYAQWEITNKHNLRFMEDSATLTLNQGSNTLPIPADYRELLDFRVTNGINFMYDLAERFLEYDEFVETFQDPTVLSQSAPTYWTIFNGNIIFSWPADRSYTLKLDYLKKSAKLVETTDVLDIPDEYAELVEIGAFMRIAKREDDFDVSAAEKQYYQELKIALIHEYARDKRQGGLRRMGTR